MPAPKLICIHDVPVFGCDACVHRDKVSILAQARYTTAAPACPECGTITVYYESDFNSMTLSFVCPIPDCESDVDVHIPR